VVGDVNSISGDPVAQAAAGEGDELVGTDDHLAAGRGGVADEVVGEQRPPPLPVLGVQQAAVAGLERLDRLDLEQGRDVVHRNSSRGCATSSLSERQPPDAGKRDHSPPGPPLWITSVWVRPPGAPGEEHT
jgi:hypothetical protein